MSIDKKFLEPLNTHNSGPTSEENLKKGTFILSLSHPDLLNYIVECLGLFLLVRCIFEFLTWKTKKVFIKEDRREKLYFIPRIYSCRSYKKVPYGSESSSK